MAQVEDKVEGGIADQAEGGAAPAAERKPRNRKRFWRIVCIISAVVLVAALAVIGVIAYSYWQGRATYDEIAQDAFSSDDGSSESIEEKLAEPNGLADITVDWDALRATNPDVVAWVYIPDTMVNYPVVQASDNEAYLHTDFKGNVSIGASYGTIFLDYQNNPDFLDACSMMYGHNMNDGSMFAALAKFTDATFFNEHRTIYVLTPRGNYRLETFALDHVSNDAAIVQLGFESDEQRNAYVQERIDTSVVTPTEGLAQATDLGKVFAFATCDNYITDGRWILFASVVESTVAGADTGASGNEAAEVSDADIAAVNAG